MHKVRGNYGSSTRGVAKMHPTAVEASGKGEDGVKPGWNSVEHRKWCVLEFDPQLKANVLFWRFFFDLTRFLSKLDGIGAVFPWVCRKHCETPWKLVPACFNTPSKKDSTNTFRGFWKVGFQWEKTDGQVISVWENLRFSFWESEWRPWRFSLKKWEPPDTGFYPAFAFEHLQHHSGDDLTDFFPHPSLVLYSFATPPIELKPKQQIGARPWIANHVDRSSWWANLLGSGEITLNPIFSVGALHQLGQATRLIVRTHYTVTLGFKVYASSYYLTPKAPPSLSQITIGSSRNFSFPF